MEVLATKFRVVCDEVVEPFALAFLCPRYCFQESLPRQCVENFDSLCLVTIWDMLATGRHIGSYTPNLRLLR